jgi:hypothetical protein
MQAWLQLYLMWAAGASVPLVHAAENESIPALS